MFNFISNNKLPFNKNFLLGSMMLLSSCSVFTNEEKVNQNNVVFIKDLEEIRKNTHDSVNEEDISWKYVDTLWATENIGSYIERRELSLESLSEEERLKEETIIEKYDDGLSGILDSVVSNLEKADKKYIPSNEPETVETLKSFSFNSVSPKTGNTAL